MGDELDDFVIEPVRSDDEPDLSADEAPQPGKRKGTLKKSSRH
jgi:hypothetical protein